MKRLGLLLQTVVMYRERPMNNRHTLFVLFILVIFSGCASIHSGDYASEQLQFGQAQSDKQYVATAPPEQGRDLVISGTEVGLFSSDYLGMLDFTFENLTSKWMRIDKVSIDFGDPVINSEVQVPIGSDIVVWYEAIQQKVDIYNFNMQQVLGAIAGVGGVAAGIGAATNNKRAMGFGAVTIIGAASVAAFSNMDSTLREVQISKVVPRSHLLFQEFIIPPGLHTKKWILFYTPNPLDIPYLSSLFLTLLFDNGEERKMKLNFRSCFGGGSNWQGKHPKKPDDLKCEVKPF